MEINVRGTYLTAHYFLPLLLKSPSASLITLTSLCAHSISPGASASQTAKFAICRFTEFIHQEYADQGLTAIAIHPGSVRTDLSLNTLEYIHDSLTDSSELPADTIAWLVKEKREWLSGRFVSCNWDMNELEKRRNEILRKDLLKFRLTIYYQSHVSYVHISRQSLSP
jgi:NAD(P)-dependent dehydrogenase (short-subunit alcohol dehydrogenase family)